MFNYKKFLNETDFSDNELEIFQSETEKHVEIFGTKKELLYLASCIIRYIEEDYAENDQAELNFDSGVDIKSGSSSLCVFVSKKSE